MLAHDIIGTQSVLDVPLLQAAFDVPSLRRPCAPGAEASRDVVSAKSHWAAHLKFTKGMSAASHDP